MPDSPAKDALVAAVHANPRRGVFAVTGGGTGLFSTLLAVPGGSATVLEAHVPYAADALRDFLGTPPSQACSAETTRALAMRCFLRAREFGGDFGFAITASLATDRPKRGTHRAHWAFQDAAIARSWTCSGGREADAGSGSGGGEAGLWPAARWGKSARRAEERLVEEAGLHMLAFSLGVADAPGFAAETATIGRYADVVLGLRSHVAERRFGAVLPGAFNPLHDGHRRMRADAAQRLGIDVGYELSVVNVDKPPLGYFDVQSRLRQFDSRDVVVTRAPTFLEKARALSSQGESGSPGLGGPTFVVGTDTIARIAAPRYYGTTRERDAAIEEMRSLGCRFLVYGRIDEGGSFKTADDLPLPQALKAICTNVPESEFRSDLSSTAMRAKGAGRSAEIASGD